MPKASPIASIPADASIPVLMVTIILMLALHAAAPKSAPPGKAILVVLDRGAGGVADQVADKGGVVSGEVV